MTISHFLMQKIQCRRSNNLWQKGFHPPRPPQIRECVFPGQRERERESEKTSERCTSSSSSLSLDRHFSFLRPYRSTHISIHSSVQLLWTPLAVVYISASGADLSTRQAAKATSYSQKTARLSRRERAPVKGAAASGRVSRPSCDFLGRGKEEDVIGTELLPSQKAIVFLSNGLSPLSTSPH